jgi:hypothetical protein
MIDPLHGARLKVIWAQQHLRAFRDDIAAYLTTKPYVFPVEQDPDFPIGQPVITEQPPVTLSLILGDCLTNARAALDYIAWQLAVRFFDPPVNIGEPHDRRITTFPLFDRPNEGGYLNRINGWRNRQVPAAVLDRIESVQPYNGWEPLWWLHELVNEDKHRSPRLTVAVLPNQVGTSGGFGAVQDWIPHADAPWDGPMQEVKVDHQFTFHVALEDVAMPREPVDLLTSKIVKAVVDVIPRFEPFFRP